MARITVPRTAACTPLTTRTERPDASCRLTQAVTPPAVRCPHRWISELADGTALSSEPASVLCGAFATTA